MSYVFFFFFKQKTAYEMRISDWSSDVCSSDLVDLGPVGQAGPAAGGEEHRVGLELDLAVGGLGHHLVRTGEAAAAVEDRDALAVEQRAGAPLEGLLDLADPLPEEIGVDLGGGGPQPHLVGPADRRQRAAREIGRAHV